MSERDQYAVALTKMVSRRFAGFAIAWHALVFLILACLPLIKYGEIWARMPPGEYRAFELLLAAYAVSALAALLFIRGEGGSAAVRALALGLCVLCVCFATLLFSRSGAPRYLLLPTLAAFLILPLSVMRPWAAKAGAAVLALALIAAGALAWRSFEANPRKGKVETSYVKSAFYGLELTTHMGVVPEPATRGGGLDRLGDDLLLGDGAGALYLLSFDETGRIQARELPTRVPANREAFAAAFGGSAQAPKRSSEYSEAGPPRVQTWRFRIADVIAQTDGDEARIFASHHYWKEEEGCFVVRVSMIEGSLGALDESLGSASWRTLYETTPCVPLTGPQRKLGKNPFKGEEVGGRMALLDEHTLLLTLGDHGFSGLESLQSFAQDPDAAYGKTIRIDIDDQSHEIYTLGHRNPQGLYVAEDGRVWLTEHGPQGGDEVNLLAPQADYGWPRVTYGTEYGALAWPLSARQGRHSGFVEPAFAWLPSIGVSSLIGVERDLFEVWRGDLIAGSLATRSLYRLVIEGDRIVLAEQLPVGRRVRDLIELDDGRLLLWTDDAALVTMAPAQGASGAMSFATLCAGCHNSKDGLSHGIGPDLYRIIDRPVASAEGYDSYSSALRNFGGTWTRERLGDYLRDPQATAPGTTMAFAGIADDAERAAVLDHLATLSAAGERD